MLNLITFFFFRFKELVSEYFVDNWERECKVELKNWGVVFLDISTETILFWKINVEAKNTASFSAAMWTNALFKNVRDKICNNLVCKVWRWRPDNDDDDDHDDDGNDDDGDDDDDDDCDDYDNDDDDDDEDDRGAGGGVENNTATVVIMINCQIPL